MKQSEKDSRRFTPDTNSDKGRIMPLNGSLTRLLPINPQLVAANWKLDDRSLVRFEIPVDGYDEEPWNGHRLLQEAFLNA